MKVLNYDFEGPYDVSREDLPSNKAAIYVIICETKDNKTIVIDVGESGEIGIRIPNHEGVPAGNESVREN